MIYFSTPHLDSVKETFGVLENGDVKVDPERQPPSQLYWIFKHQYTFQEAQLWCLKRKMQASWEAMCLHIYLLNVCVVQECVVFWSVIMGFGFQAAKEKNSVMCLIFVMKALCISRVYCILTLVYVEHMTNPSGRHAL